MKKYVNQFWNWYENHLRINLGIATGLFVLQIVHLIWLTSDVVIERLFSFALLNLSGVWESLIIIVDYSEIPAIITVSFVYLNELRKGISVRKNLWFISLLNSQWIHLLWITDEFVLAHFRGEHLIFPLWLIWTAIMIDYLELPVLYDTIKKFFAIAKE